MLLCIFFYKKYVGDMKWLRCSTLNKLAVVDTELEVKKILDEIDEVEELGDWSGCFFNCQALCGKVATQLLAIPSGARLIHLEFQGG